MNYLKNVRKISYDFSIVFLVRKNAKEKGFLEIDTEIEK